MDANLLGGFRSIFCFCFFRGFIFPVWLKRLSFVLIFFLRERGRIDKEEAFIVLCEKRKKKTSIRRAEIVVGKTGMAGGRTEVDAGELWIFIMIDVDGRGKWHSKGGGVSIRYS